MKKRIDDNVYDITLFNDYEPKNNYPELTNVVPELCKPRLEVSLSGLGTIDEQKVSRQSLFCHPELRLSLHRSIKS